MEVRGVEHDWATFTVITKVKVSKQMATKSIVPPLKRKDSVYILGSVWFSWISEIQTMNSSDREQTKKASPHAAAKSLQLLLILCNPIDGSPPGSLIPGILQARTLEWVATSFSNAWKWKVKVKSLSCVQLLTTPWTAAYQAPLPMEFSRQEHWSGLSLHVPLGDTNS